MRKAHLASVSADDAWARRAYAASVAAAKDLVGDQGPIRSNTPIGRLGDPEWAWIASAIIWSWVSVRSEQATTEGWDLERTVRATALEPCAWDTGAIVGMLPKLADACLDFDWSVPAGAWSKETLAGFLLTAFNLIERAKVARDVVEAQVAGKPINADATARQINAAKALDDDDCPF